MRASGLICVVTLLALLWGCSRISEEDLESLRDVNVATKAAALDQIARGDGVLSTWLHSSENDERAVHIIRKMLSDKNKTDDEAFCLLGLSALGRLAERVEVPVSVCVEKMASDNPNVRRKAVQILAKIGGQDAEKLLAERVKRDADDYAAIWALGEVGDKKVVPLLNDMLESDDTFVRYNAYKALAKVSQKGGGKSRISTGGDRRRLSDLGKNAFEAYTESMIRVFKQIGVVKRS